MAMRSRNMETMHKRAAGMPLALPVQLSSNNKKLKISTLRKIHAVLRCLGFFLYSF